MACDATCCAAFEAWPASFLASATARLASWIACRARSCARSASCSFSRVRAAASSGGQAVGVTVAAPPSPPAEFVPNQTPAKPAPFEVKLVDQGKFDPRLKGLMAPDGFKTEIVADDTSRWVQSSLSGGVAALYPALSPV